MAFSPSTLLPNFPPQKKQKNSQILQTSRKKPMRGWPGTGLRVLFNSVLHFHKTINFPKENCAKIIRPSSSFEKSTTILPKLHLLFKGILRLLQHPDDPDAFARPKEKFFELNKYLRPLQISQTFYIALLNSSQDRLLQMPSYVAILETAKGCYSKCMSLDAIRYGWQLANGAERAKKSQNFTEKTQIFSCKDLQQSNLSVCGCAAELNKRKATSHLQICM